ncbi:hypothetical protein C2R22_02505 [Salinigranum rubrum]|uniref:Uncharacterized protein n=1 Tax=Salinigranum rubrum TaxID=755307 RepID=A0A2I8VFE9_9EURY|nr:hypothetical protein [Salinigranum rubrum]AUV80662.1 hypothetical protein C2R22_02505 [Salinigranum rubrum]
MNTKTLVLGAVALVLVGCVGLLLGGFGPAPAADSDDTGSFPTETPDRTPSGEQGGSASDATATATPLPPFAFTVDGTEECGRTCRDVTSTVTNQQETTAEDVTVYTRVYAGRGTDGGVIWEGRERVGTLDAGASYTATRRVELSFTDAIAIQQNGGWVTVQTTVRTADRTLTLTDQRQVG